MAKVITCKAAVITAPGEPFKIIDVNVFPPQAGEIRLKVLYVAPCHTDELTQRGVDPQAKYPVILGHEATAVVESVGEGVSICNVGDIVIPVWQPQCFEDDRKNKTCVTCEGYSLEKTNICGKLSKATVEGVMKNDGKPRFTMQKCNTPIYHFMGVSCFSQYAVVHQESVAVIPKDSALDKVCLLGCGVATGLGAAVNTAKVTEGSVCAVFGLGAVGLGAVEGCKIAKAREIYAVDINDEKLKLAAELGATKCVNTKKLDKPIQDFFIEETNGGLDFALECTGNTSVMRGALESTRKGWGLCVVCGVAESGEVVQTRPYNFIVGRQWKGTSFGGWKGRRDLPMLVDWYKEGKISLDKFVTRQMPFGEINEAFDLLRTGQCIRCVLDMWKL